MPKTVHRMPILLLSTIFSNVGILSLKCQFFCNHLDVGVNPICRNGSYHSSRTNIRVATAYLDYGGCDYGGLYGECDPNPNPYHTKTIP